MPKGIKKRVNGDGTVSYQASVRLTGYKPRYNTFATVAEAERWRRETMVSLQKGFDVDTTRLRKDSVGELFDRFEGECCPKRKGGDWEVKRIRFFRETDWFHRRLNQDVAGALREWVAKRRREASDETVRRDLALISSVFTTAIKDWGVPLPINPVSLVRRPPAATKGVGQLWTDEMLEKLRAAAGECDGRVFQLRHREPMVKDYVVPALELALATGMRPGEICSFTRDNVHLDQKRIWLERTKNGDSRNVLLSSTARRVIEMLMPFAGEDGRVVPLNSDSLGVEYREIRAAAGLGNIRFYDSRGTAVTRAAKLFDSAMDLARFSGHKDLRVLDRRYYHPNPTELADRLG